MKTVKVRIAVAVDPSGDWSASGWSKDEDQIAMEVCCDGVDPGEFCYWVTAELEVPRSFDVEGTVEEALK